MPGKGGVLSPRSPFNGAAAFLAISSRSSCFLRCAPTFAFSASISAGVPPSRSRGTAGASPRPASEVGTIGAPSLFAGAGGGTISKFSSVQLAVSSGCAATYSSIASSLGKVIFATGVAGAGVAGAGGSDLGASALGASGGVSTGAASSTGALAFCFASKAALMSFAAASASGDGAAGGFASGAATGGTVSASGAFSPCAGIASGAASPAGSTASFSPVSVPAAAIGSPVNAGAGTFHASGPPYRSTFASRPLYMIKATARRTSRMFLALLSLPCNNVTSPSPNFFRNRGVILSCRIDRTSATASASPSLTPRAA